MKTEGLQTTFQRLRKRASFLHLTCAGSWALLAAIAAVTAAVWIDLIVALPPEIRLLSCAAAAVVGVTVVASGVRKLIHDTRDLYLARRLDRVASTRGQIAAGVDLAARSQGLPLVAASLAHIAIERATALASDIHPHRAIPARDTRRAGVALLGFLGAMSVAAILMPRLARVEWLRFSDPYGDHPPFSRTTFEVTPGNTHVIYGRGFDVEAVVHGPPVERLELVVADATSKRAEEVFPMFPERDGHWRASLTQLTSGASYYVRAQRTRSVRYRIEVITVPGIESVQLRIEPPAYTRQAVYEGALPAMGITGLPGTRVTIQAHSNRPLSGGSIRLEWAGQPAQTLAMQSEGSTHAGASFSIVAEGKLSLRVRDVDGQDSTDDFSAAIHLLQDQRPFVRLLRPEAVAIATPAASLPVTVQADDDFGIARVQLYRSLNDSRPLPTTLPTRTSQPASLEESIELPLSRYGLQPGDTIKLFARAEDNDPAGAKGAESSITTVRIVSQEDFERLVRAREGLEVLMSKYAAANRRMEAVAEQIEKLMHQLATQPADSPLAREMREQLQALARQMQEEAKAIQEASTSDLPYDADRALRQHLEKAASRLSRAAEQARALGDDSALTGAQARAELKKLASQCQGGRGDLQKYALAPLDRLAAVYPLMEDQARFVVLYQQQQSLADRLAAMKGQSGQDQPELRARFRDLETEQRQIRKELEALTDDIRSHLAQVPADKEFEKLRKSTEAFLDEFGKSGAVDQQRNAESQMAALQGTLSFQAAAEAAETMSRFISRCQGMKGEGSACLRFSPNLGDAMAATAEQLLADAGLGQGSKPGMGIGSGYSAQRSSLSNVGLYGRIPAVGQVSSAGGKEAHRAGRATGSASTPGGKALPLEASPEAIRAAATADNVVPPAYRARVGRYFERLAEELDAKPQK